MAASTARNLGIIEDWLIDPLSFLVPQNEPTWVTVAFYTIRDGKYIWTEDHVRTEDLAEYLSKIDLDRDLWITQNQFRAERRQKANVAYVPSFFCDCDIRKDTSLISDGVIATVSDAIPLLKKFFKENGIPLPSIINNTGNGLHVKWLFPEALHISSPSDPLLQKWEAAQTALIKLLQSFGGDVQARDACRVLRIIGSSNVKKDPKNPLPVYMEEANDARFNFEDLAQIFVDTAQRLYPEPVKPKKEKKSKPEKAPKGKKEKTPKAHPASPSPAPVQRQRENVQPEHGNIYTLRWHHTLAARRAEDIKKLGDLRRAADGVMPEGSRELQTFFTLLFESTAGLLSSAVFDARAQQLIDSMGGDFTTDKTPEDFKALRERLESTEAGCGWEKWEGQTVPLLYRYKNKTIIKVLKITPEEQKQLKTIIGPEEKQRRYMLRHPNSTGQTREEYLAENEENSLEPWLYVIQTNKRGIQKEGISRRTWFNWKKLNDPQKNKLMGEAMYRARRERGAMANGVQKANQIIFQTQLKPENAKLAHQECYYLEKAVWPGAPNGKDTVYHTRQEWEALRLRYCERLGVVEEIERLGVWTEEWKQIRDAKAQRAWEKETKKISKKIAKEQEKEARRQAREAERAAKRAQREAALAAEKELKRLVREQQRELKRMAKDLEELERKKWKEAEKMASKALRIITSSPPPPIGAGTGVYIGEG